MPVVKRFNFMTDVEPMLNITLPSGKTLDITPCTKGEYERYLHSLNRISKAISEEIGADEEEHLINDLYSVAASLMSHNTANMLLTGETLRGEHDITPERLIGFLYAYCDYTADIHSLKN